MRVLKVISFAFSNHSRYCIIGLGSGGLSLTSHLLRSGIHPSEIRVIDPSPKHYYQPGWTMVGAGQWQILPTETPIEHVIPKDIAFQQDRLKLVKPSQNKVVCESGQEYTYDELILATGLRLQYQKVQGLQQALNDPNSNVATIYQLNFAEKVARLGAKIRSGKAIFTQPALPIKCAGAPQKILYLWTDKWRSQNLPIDVQFFKTNAVMFGVPKYSQKLVEVASSYNIKTTFKHPLIKVDGDEATFQNADTKELVVKKFDFLHVVPPMGPHPYIAESGLADAAGYLDVNKNTLRHNKYSNIWGVGDCTSVPCSKTAAAAFSQTQALHSNLMALRKNPTLTNLPGIYEGYASCPLFVGKMKLMLAQFKLFTKTKKSLALNFTFQKGSFSLQLTGCLFLGDYGSGAKGYVGADFYASISRQINASKFNNYLSINGGTTSKAKLQQVNIMLDRIEYKGVKQINYLSDFVSLDHSNAGFLQGLNNPAQNTQKKQQSKFDNIANELYKKIVKQGYVEKPSTVSKKGKKGDADFNYYNLNDNFIDDEQIIEKKDILSQFKDYKCIPVTSLQELYSSPQYKAKAEQAVSQALKRKAPDQFNPDNEKELQKFDQVRKKIKNNIKELILNQLQNPKNITNQPDNVSHQQQKKQSSQKANEKIGQ